MNTKLLRRIIIFLIAIFTIILLIFFTIKFKNKDNVLLNLEKEDEYSSEYGVTEKVEEEHDFYTIGECLFNYNRSIYLLNTDDPSITFSETEKREKIYNQLSTEYIKVNKITLDNMFNYIDINITGDLIYPIQMVQYIEENSDITCFGVKSEIINIEKNESYYVFYKVLYDYNNNTYAIEPVKENDINRINMNYSIESIEENEDNKCTLLFLSAEQKIQKYFNRFNNELLYNISQAYTLLDNEYKNLKFKNISDFESYIESNKLVLKSNTLEKYQINQYDDYREYVCIDKYGNYYIFDEKGIMDYTVKFDTYAVETEESIAEYNEKNNEEKIKINLNKIAQAINRHDYEYLYSKLDEGLRTSSFQNYEELKNYINNNFYSVNKFSYSDSDIQGAKGVFEMQIADGTGEEENIIEKNFIVTLGEGTNYTISFNI